jgi:hypothetical protein
MLTTVGHNTVMQSTMPAAYCNLKRTPHNALQPQPQQPAHCLAAPSKHAADQLLLLGLHQLHRHGMQPLQRL